MDTYLNVMLLLRQCHINQWTDLLHGDPRRRHGVTQRQTKKLRATPCLLCV